MVARIRRWLIWLSVIVLFAASTYCALWMLASFDLAFAACEGGFSLFAPTFRCRQPHIAAILCLLFALATAGLLLMLRWKRRPLTEPEPLSRR